VLVRVQYLSAADYPGRRSTAPGGGVAGGGGRRCGGGGGGEGDSELDKEKVLLTENRCLRQSLCEVHTELVTLLTTTPTPSTTPLSPSSSPPSRGVARGDLLLAPRSPLVDPHCPTTSSSSSSSRWLTSHDVSEG